MFPGVYDSEVARGKRCADGEEGCEVFDGDVLRNCEGDC